MQILVFDIETVPDTANGARLNGLEGLDPPAIAAAMRAARGVGADGWLPLHLQRVVAISVLRQATDGSVVLRSLGDPDKDDEAQMIQQFFAGLERYNPVLVSWNGGGFDLPVLHYRALLHGIEARHYWENGDHDRDFRYNNYLSRFHWRHTDLMDVLSGFSPRAYAKLDELAVLLGLPGKLGLGGDRVAEAYFAGEHGKIRDYCECDVLNTYLIYLRFELMRGNLMSADYDAQCDRLREMLKEDGREHIGEFLELWKAVAA